MKEELGLFIKTGNFYHFFANKYYVKCDMEFRTITTFVSDDVNESLCDIKKLREKYGSPLFCDLCLCEKSYRKYLKSKYNHNEEMTLTIANALGFRLTSNDWGTVKEIKFEQ